MRYGVCEQRRRSRVGNEAMRAAGCRCWNATWIPATWRQQCFDRYEPFLGRTSHASLPIADRPSIDAELLSQTCLSQSQQLLR